MTAARPILPIRPAPDGAVLVASEGGNREDVLLDTFVGLASGLVPPVDIAELLKRLVEQCVQLLAASSVGLILADEHGELAVLASSSAEQHVLELFELQSDEGPCLHCIRTGGPVRVDDLAADEARWPRWAPAAVRSGVASAYALPMRQDDVTFGALNLFGDRVGLLGPQDLRVGQALADVATSIVLSTRQVRRAEQLSAQLQTALDSRIVIEQAKGVVATALGVSVDDAFVILRRHSRTRNLRLIQVASDITTGTMGSDSLSVGR